MDISLDPWPYAGNIAVFSFGWVVNRKTHHSLSPIGTTTTCESLFMGVPVITYEGKNHACNVGKSLLSNIGLPEFIAMTDDQYVDIAVALGLNPKKIQETR